MFLTLSALSALAGAEPAWVAENGPWGDAPIAAAERHEGVEYVLTDVGLFADGVRVQTPDLSDLSTVQLAGGQVARTSANELCLADGPSWRCLPSDGFLALLAPGWAGGLYGHLRSLDTWERVDDPRLPATANAHIKTVVVVDDGIVVVPFLGDWVHLRNEGPSRFIPRPPSEEALVPGEGPCPDSARLARAGGLWKRSGAGWEPVAGAERATACRGDLVALPGGRLARWTGAELTEIPTAASADIRGIAAADLAWSGSQLLRPGPLPVAFRDEAARRGLADPGPTRVGWFIDLGGDGWPDLVTWGDAGARVYRNQQGRFTSAAPLQAAWQRPVGAACDLDGDGFDDLVVADMHGLTLWRGGETLVSAQRGIDRPELHAPANDVDCPDLDGDGDPDVFVTLLGAEGDAQPVRNAAWENTGQGRLRRADPAHRGLGGSLGWDLRSTFVDWEGDGQLDRVVAGAWAPAEVWLEHRQPDGRWQLGHALGAAYGEIIEAPLADFDQDGRLDLFLVRLVGAGALLGREDGVRAVEVPVTDQHGWAWPHGPSGAAATDIDGDGRVDVVVNGPRGARVFRNRACRDQAVCFDVLGSEVGLTRASTASLAFADIDRDGDLDVFGARTDGADVLWLNARMGPGVPPVVRVARTSAVMRRAAWLHHDEALLRAALWLLALALVVRRSRRLQHVLLGQLAAAPGLVLVWAAVELQVGEGSPTLRWGVIGGALGALWLLSLGDERLTETLRATRIAGYRVRGRLGSGGMATVHLVTRGSGRFALKVMHPELAADADARARFRREAELGARLSHPNLVRIHEAGECTVFNDGQPSRTLYLLMELVDGPSLRTVMQGPIPLGQAARLVLDVLAALDAMHADGVVHRDLKPENLLIGSDGTVRIADFGIARGDASRALTRTGHVMGTLAYMAPEQLRGEEPDERVDLYAAGVLAYELLAGRTPFAADEGLELVYLVLNQQIPPLDEALPQALRAAILRALSADPAARGTTADLAEALAAHADDALDVSAWPTSSVPDDEPPPTVDATVA